MTIFLFCVGIVIAVRIFGGVRVALGLSLRIFIVVTLEVKQLTRDVVQAFGEIFLIARICLILTQCANHNQVPQSRPPFVFFVRMTPQRTHFFYFIRYTKIPCVHGEKKHSGGRDAATARRKCAGGAGKKTRC